VIGQIVTSPDDERRTRIMINTIDIDIDGIAAERFDAPTAVSGMLVPGLGRTNC